MENITRILIVEDNLADAELNKREALKVLSNCEFKIVETETDFLETLSSFKPHLILSDYSMPAFDGLTALSLAMEHAAETPVIIVTGSVNEDTAVECMQAGAVNYVIKQSIKRLGTAILHALNERELKIQHLKSQEALKESELRYRTLFSLSPVGILLQNEHNVIIDANENYCKITGYDKTDLLGKHISIIVPENDIDSVQLNTHRIFEGKQLRYEAESIRKDGTVFYIELTESKVILPNGAIGIMSIADDITQRKIAEKNLELKNNHLQMLSDYALKLTDIPADGNFSRLVVDEIKLMTGAVFAAYSEYNPRARSLITRNISASQKLINSLIKLAGKRILNVESPVSEEAYQHILIHSSRAFQSLSDLSFGSISQIIDNKIKILTGINRYYGISFFQGDELYGTAAFGLRKDQPDPDKEMLSSIARLTSLTLRRRKAEDELKEREERLRKILNSSQDAMIIFDTEGGIYLWNQSAEKMFGYSSNEVIGKGIQKLIVPERFYSRFKQGVNNFGNTGQGPAIGKIIEIQALRKSGEEIPVEIAMSSIKFDDAFFSVGSFRDISERKQAEIEFISSEKRYHELFDAYKDGIAVIRIDADTSVSTFLELNHSAAAMLGYSHREMMNIPLYQLESGYNEQCMIQRRTELERKSNTTFETQYIHKSGQLIPVEISASIINYTGVPALLNIVRDISERKFRENLQKLQYKIANAVINADTLYELYEAVRLGLADLIDTRNFFIAFLKPESGMLYAPFEKEEKNSVHEWPAEKSLTGLVIEQQKSLLLTRSQISEMATSGIINLIGTRSEIWLGVPLYSGKKIIGAMVVQSYENPYAYNKDSIYILELAAHELSNYISRKEAEQNALKLSKAIEQNPVSIVITNKKGIIEYVNPKFSEITGYSRAEAMDKNPSILKSGYHNNEFYENLWNTIANGHDWQGELKNKKKDGSFYWENAIISPILDEKGTITHFVAVKEDVTEKKRFLEELKIAKEKAEESDRLKTAFLQNISHEIRTPLNGILGFSDLLIQEWTTQEERIEYNESIQISGKRLVEIISNVLDISIIETGQVMLNPVNFNLNSFLHNLFNFYNSAALQKGLKLTYNADCKDDQCVITADQNRIHQVMTNLLNNAIKYTKKGNIHFDYKINNGEVIFSVSDTGIGIDPSHHSRIFTRFYQAEHSTARSYEGAGLGLSISHGLVKAMGGSIWFESEAGKGSTFSFSIPAAEKLSKDSKIPFQGNIIPDDDIVLIADDDDTSYILLKTMLKKRQVVILRAETGVEAINLVKKYENIKLVLMDVKMPVMNGLEATRIIKTMRPGLPIIMQTAYAFLDDIGDGFAVGCDDYLSKPISTERLNEVYEKYLGTAK